MSDAVTVALIGGAVTVLGFLINRTHKLVNSRMDQFLAVKDALLVLAKQISYKEGLDAGAKEEKDSHAEKG